MLRANTLASIFWSMITTWGEQIITFALLIVLARLLSPSEFGVVALAGLSIYVLQDIVRITVNQTLVQMENVDDTHFATVFWFILVVTGSVTGGLILLAEPLARAFDEPILAQITPWMSIILVCSACEIVQEARLVRKLNFKPLAVRSLSAASLGGAVSITMAMAGYGVWSIVVQQIIYAVVMVSVTWYFARWIPPLIFSWSHFKDVARFGRYITAMSVIEFVYTRIDVVLIGATLGTQAVGLYNTGLRILRLLLNGIAGALVRALLPALSRLQNEPDRMREAYLRCLRLSSIVTVPVFAGLSCVSHEAVYVLLGPKWIEAVPVVAILGLAGMMQSFGLLTSTTVLACGQVRAMFFVTLAYAVAYLVAMLIGIQWGIVGVATAFLVTVCLMDNLHAIVLSRAIDLRLRDIARTFIPVATATAAMAAAILTVKQMLILSSYVALPLYMALGMAVYGSVLALIAPRLRGDMLTAFGEMFRRKKPVTAQ